MLPAISDNLNLIFRGIAGLKAAYPHRAFTIDGRLVGDIGEIIASLEYDLVLHETSQPSHDGDCSDGRRVQVKATFKDSLTFRFMPDYYLGIRLSEDGKYKEIYNGPGRYIEKKYGHRKGFGSSLLSFPCSELERISGAIPTAERIPKRPKG